MQPCGEASSCGHGRARSRLQRHVGVASACGRLCSWLACDSRCVLLALAQFARAQTEAYIDDPCAGARARARVVLGPCTAHGKRKRGMGITTCSPPDTWGHWCSDILEFAWSGSGNRQTRFDGTTLSTIVGWTERTKQRSRFSFFEAATRIFVGSCGVYG